MSSARKNDKAIRVTNETYARVRLEAERRRCDMGTAIEASMPGYRMEHCCYCQRFCRQSTIRHRWHDEKCPLFEDKDLRLTPMAGANKKSG